jgi:hypothetical protein
MFQLKWSNQYGIFGIYYTGHGHSSGSLVEARHKNEIIPL